MTRANITRSYEISKAAITDPLNSVQLGGNRDAIYPNKGVKIEIISSFNGKREV